MYVIHKNFISYDIIIFFNFLIKINQIFLVLTLIEKMIYF